MLSNPKLTLSRPNICGVCVAIMAHTQVNTLADVGTDGLDFRGYFMYAVVLKGLTQFSCDKSLSQLQMIKQV